MRRKIEIHLIKNYPFANLNRDEFGTPKNFVFAGHPHGRISSQSLKRSWREFFKNELDLEDISIRTRALPTLVKESLEKSGKDEEFIKLAVKAVKDIFRSDKKETKGNKEDEKKELITGQVIPLTPDEIEFFKEEFTNITLKELKDEKEYKEFLKGFKTRYSDLGPTIDIALWGRMVTSSVVNSSEAAMQVAHAVSTHPVNIEQDIFTAVDDYIKQGAGMYGTAEFNSCCYYEYACLDFDLLVENLGGDEDAARNVIPMIIKAMAFSNPSGKSTSTGTNILPSAMMVESKAVPYNLVNAFAKVDYAQTNNLIVNSVEKLAKECTDMQNAYCFDSKRYWYSFDGITCDSAICVRTFPELVEKASKIV